MKKETIINYTSVNTSMNSWVSIVKKRETWYKIGQVIEMAGWPLYILGIPLVITGGMIKLLSQPKTQ